jgi:hypothetical protein
MKKPYDAMSRLVQARHRIIKRSPWFKAITEANDYIHCDIGISLLATDGLDVFYDPKVMQIYDRYIEGCLLHEYLHCLCDHIARRQDRNAGLWNVAADYAINPLVTKLFDMPAGLTLLNPKFAGMSVENIYDALGGKRGGSGWQGPLRIGASLAEKLKDLPPDLSGEPLQRARRIWRDAIALAGQPPAFIQAAIEETIAAR